LELLPHGLLGRGIGRGYPHGPAVPGLLRPLRSYRVRSTSSTPGAPGPWRVGETPR